MDEYLNSDPLSLVNSHKQSFVNGLIKRLKVDQLRHWLQVHGHETRGNKEVLSKRLRALAKKNYQRLSSPTKYQNNVPTDKSEIRYFFVMDIEATCEEPLPKDYPHEIIELPIVVVDGETTEIVAEFKEICRPIQNPALSNFCVELTGISQSDIDNAETFADVFSRLSIFLEPFLQQPAVLVTDSPYDVYRFLLPACQQHKIKFPKWAKKWVNVRKMFSNFYSTERMNIAGMLSKLGLDFDGRPHCGLDDARNIAKILITLLNDKCCPLPNEGLTREVQSSLRCEKSLPQMSVSLTSRHPDQIQKINLGMLNLAV